MQRIIDRVLKNSRLVDTESLVIVPGEQVWNIRVDIHVLDHDGNIIDASVAAAVAALSDYRRPEFTILDDGSVKIVLMPSCIYALIRISILHLRSIPFR